MSITLRGLSAAPGIGLGNLFVHIPLELGLDFAPAPAEASVHDPRREWRRFLAAQTAVDNELILLGESLDTVAADIFAIHRVILQDKTLTENVRNAIHYNDADAVTATRQVIKDMADIFRVMDDDYFASRAADILDIGRRLLTQLGAASDQTILSDLPPNTILIAEELTPTDITQLPVEQVTGIGLAYSTPTAHTSILARSLGLPLVCGLGADIMRCETGHAAILDANQGLLIVNPPSDEIEIYGDARRVHLQQQALAITHTHEPAITVDGIHIPVYANANTEADVYAHRKEGADGIGLLRTEYLFQGRSAPPSVDEQTEVYARMAVQTEGRVLTIRALDVGGDKPMEYVLGKVEMNPFLGLRGTRLLLANPSLLCDQFRAVVEVACSLPANAKLRFMLPMVSTVSEMEQIHHLLDDIRCRAGGGGATVEIGVLIEVPAAALMAERMAQSVDFFSIGTNDLAQYVLASDRTNPAVAALADPLHPAVLQLIARSAYAAKVFDIPISLCGEMGGDISAVPLLLGLGITELSVPLPATPMVKQTIRSCNMIQCRQIAESALRCNDAERVHALLAAVT